MQAYNQPDYETHAVLYARMQTMLRADYERLSAAGRRQAQSAEVADAMCQDIERLAQRRTLEQTEHVTLMVGDCSMSIQRLAAVYHRALVAEQMHEPWRRWLYADVGRHLGSSCVDLVRHNFVKAVDRVNLVEIVERSLAATSL